MNIRLYDRQDTVTALGPGQRYVIWTQGCERRCPGCMSPQSRPLDGGYEIDIHELALEIIKTGHDGITISGGEPFLQADKLVLLIEKIKQSMDVGIIVYTGFTLEELQKREQPEIKEFLKQIDLLVDGPYVDELNDGKNLRGSSNQRAIPLTDRYLNEAKEYGTKSARVEFFMHEDKMRVVGVPSKELLDRIKKVQW